MRAFRILNDKYNNYGNWWAEDHSDAFSIMKTDLEKNPGRYGGVPKEGTKFEVVEWSGRTGLDIAGSTKVFEYHQEGRK